MTIDTGSVGAIPALCVAAQVFTDARDYFVKAVNILGKLTWEHGLLLKGNGLSHGIAGNGYALHAIYRMSKFLINTREAEELGRAHYANDKLRVQMWRIRAFRFA